MKVLVSKLPSKGFASTLEIVDLQPLNYGQLIKYSSEGSSSSLEDFLWDIDNLICTLPNWENLSSYDVNPLIAYRKMLTLSLSGEIILINGERFGLKDIEFTDLDKTMIAIKSITLNNKIYVPSIKKMGEFYKILRAYVAEGVYEQKLAVIASFIGISPADIQSLTNEDIVICESLYPKIISQPLIKSKGGAEVILTGKSSELFQNLLKLSRIDSSKIQFSEVLQS